MPDVSPAPKSFSSEGGAVPNSYEARASLPGATIEPYTEEFSAEMEKAERLTSFDSAGNSSTNLSATSRQGGMYALREAAIARDDFMATATTKGGRPIAPSEVTPDSLVTLDMGNGARVEGRIADFERLGKIRRTAIGWERVGASQATAPARVPQEKMNAHYDEGAIPLNRQLTSVIGGVGINKLAEDFASEGKIRPETLRSISAGTGMTEAQALGLITSYTKTHASAVAREVSTLDIDPGSVIAWARKNAPAAMKGALARQLMGHDTSGWRTLAKRAIDDFISHNPAEAVTKINKRLQPHLSSDKRTVLVKVNGRVTPFRAHLGSLS